MKRVISLVLCFVMIIPLLIPSRASADSVLHRYGRVKIIVPPMGYNIEDDFREFVKKVSRTYYSGKLDGEDSVYDLNKYYYRASEVKHEWDQSGWGWWSQKDNPYSTAEGYADYNKYNVPVVQQMLIDGIQEKADEINSLGLEAYKIGLVADLQTGSWKADVNAFVAQRLYDEETSNEIVQTAISAGMNEINLLVDAIMLKNGVSTDGWAYEIWDAFCEVISKSASRYFELKHEQISAELSNQYRNALVQAVNDMYDNIEGQMLSDYRQRKSELDHKTSLSAEETMLRDQLKLLLDSIDESLSIPGMSSEELELIDEISQELVNKLGLEAQHVLKQEEIESIWKHGLISDLVYVTIKTVLDKTIKGDTLIDEIGFDVFNELMSSTAEIVTRLCLQEEAWESIDYNEDGYYSLGETALSICQYIFSDEHIVDLMKQTLVELVKTQYTSISRAQVNELSEVVEGLRGTWSALCAEFSNWSEDDVIGHGNTIYAIQNERIKLTEFEKELKVAEKKLKESEKEADKVGEFVKDILNIAQDVFKLAEKSVDLEDMADQEVFYAHIACEMYHTMMEAKAKRLSLSDTKDEYAQLRYAANIDKADIELLKRFVNRVFSVYQTDMQGHNHYIALDYGWHYQTGGLKEKEVMDRYEELKKSHDEYKGILRGVLEFGDLVIYPITRFEATAVSDYLEEVNKKYPWLSCEEAEEKYSMIAEYALSVEVPAHLRQFVQ